MVIRGKPDQFFLLNMRPSESFNFGVSRRFRASKEGADTVIWLALQQLKEKLVSGDFYFDRAETPRHLPLVATAGTKDVKAEFQIMGSAISKEMGMMKAQLNRWKETTEESIFLHEKVQSLRSLVDTKTAEEKDLAEKCDQQTQLIRSHKAYIEKKQRENEELQTYVDMVSDNIYDNRLWTNSFYLRLESLVKFGDWLFSDICTD